MRKSYTINVLDNDFDVQSHDDGFVSSQVVLLDDIGLVALQHGIKIAQGVDWDKTKWTRGEALNEYGEHISGDSRCDLVLERMDTINDIELLEFMEYMTAEDEEDRKADDAPEGS